MRVLVATLSTPVGPLEVLTREDALCGIAFEGCGAATRRLLQRRFGDFVVERRAWLGEVTDRLAGYFAGDFLAIDALGVDTGGTTFQRRVCEALRKVRPGTTVSYGELAKRIWRPMAWRAVGTATGRNPIPVVIPCHRVIAADGALGGYSGGLDRKRWLLSHEQGQSYIIR